MTLNSNVFSEDIKRGWDTDEIRSGVHPNAVCGLLVPLRRSSGFLCCSPRGIGNWLPRAAGWPSTHFTYWRLEQHGRGRILIDGDQGKRIEFALR